MRTRNPIHISQSILGGVLIGMMLLVTACGGSPQSQQQANQNKAKLDQTIQHAKAIGAPGSALQPILKQQQQLSSTGAPFSPFNYQTDTYYYTNLATRHQQLDVQSERLISNITDQ